MIAVRHRIIYSHVLEEMKNSHKELKMQKQITKNNFTNKVLKQLKEYNNVFFKIEKQMPIKDILKLLEHNFKYKIEHNFKYKIEHEKKYKKVLNELYMFFHKQQYSVVLKELLTNVEIKTKFVNFDVNINNYNTVDLFLIFFFIFVLSVKLFGEFLNLFDN